MTAPAAPMSDEWLNQAFHRAMVFASPLDEDDDAGWARMLRTFADRVLALAGVNQGEGTR